MGDHEGVFSKAQFFLEPKRPTALVGSLESCDYELSNGVKIFVGLLGPGGHLGGQRGGILEL